MAKQIELPVPDLGALQKKAQAFRPGVLVVESALVEIDPTPVGMGQGWPIVPIDPSTESFVISRELRRHSDGRVEVLTLRYESPVEQAFRMEMGELITEAGIDPNDSEAIAAFLEQYAQDQEDAAEDAAAV